LTLRIGSSYQNAGVAGSPSRLSTTIPTLSIRLSAMCPIYKVASILTTVSELHAGAR
jgi:hypothetical protein